MRDNVKQVDNFVASRMTNFSQSNFSITGGFDVFLRSILKSMTGGFKGSIIGAIVGVPFGLLLTAITDSHEALRDIAVTSSTGALIGAGIGGIGGMYRGAKAASMADGNDEKSAKTVGLASVLLTPIAGGILHTLSNFEAKYVSKSTERLKLKPNSFYCIRIVPNAGADILEFPTLALAEESNERCKDLGNRSYVGSGLDLKTNFPEVFI